MQFSEAQYRVLRVPVRRHLHQGSQALCLMSSLTCASSSSFVVLKSIQPLEKDLDVRVQIAARMLWAAVDCGCKYESFLTCLRTDFPNVLRRLHPLIIQYYVHLAAGLTEDQPSMIVFVWDEVNTVPTSNWPGKASFFQEHLSEVVYSRVSALREIRRSHGSRGFDVLLVPVVACIHGSAANLVNMPSKGARSTNLLLPLIQDGF